MGSSCSRCLGDSDAAIAEPGVAPAPASDAIASSASSTHSVKLHERTRSSMKVGAGPIVVAPKGQSISVVQNALVAPSRGSVAASEFVERASNINKKSALRSIMSNQHGLAAFRKYLTSTYSDQHLDFFLECDRLKREAAVVNDVNNPEFKAHAQGVYNLYIKPGSEGQVNLPASLISDFSNKDDKPDIAKFIKAQDAVVELMSMSCLKGFLRSDFFTEYKLNKHASESSQHRASSVTSGMYKGIAAEDEADASMTAASWIEQLQNISDALPVCICISDMTLPDRPISYVNSEFSEVTGYSAAECIGRNCSFLQGPETEPAALDEMRKAFKLHQPIHIQITNYKKNGAKFTNLLTMKPIMDANNKLQFYIAVQFDMSSGLNTEKMIQELVYTSPIISLLPDKMD